MADLGAGSFAAAGSAVLVTGACGGPLGVACPVVGSLGAVGVALGYDQAEAGTQQLFGTYQSKAGEQVPASFNPATPKSRAPLVQDAMDLGAVVLEAVAVKGILQVVKGVQGAKHADKTEGAAKEGAKGGSLVAEDFFVGTKYTDKVLAQINTGDLHAFPESVKLFQGSGQVTKITGGDAVVREMLRIPGDYRGKRTARRSLEELARRASNSSSNCTGSAYSGVPSQDPASSSVKRNCESWPETESSVSRRKRRYCDNRIPI